MTTRAKKVSKRKQRLQERRRVKGRVAVQHEGTTSTVFEQAHSGYNVEMIRDFLGQLLLELRVQQYENVRALRSVRSGGTYQQACDAAAETSQALVHQLAAYQAKHASTLLPAHAIDVEGATDEEVDAFFEIFLIRNIELRDADIGHLEALQNVIDEALLTAKLPFGSTQSGEVIQPQRVYRVREVVDEIIGTTQL
jgi:hypothetical protein